MPAIATHKFLEEKMKSPRSIRLTAGAGVLLALTAVLLHACMDEASDRNTMTTLRDPSHFQLTIRDSGSTKAGNIRSNKGGISCSLQPTLTGVLPLGVCSARYKANAVVILTAAPVTGAVLKGWSGCAVSSDNPLSCQVSMTANVTVKVTFLPPPSTFPLTVSGGAGGNGAVVSTPAGISCTITAGTAGANGCKGTFPAGQPVSLKATAGSGSYLKAWAGGGCEKSGTGLGTASGTCVVPLADAKTVVVSFELPSAQARLGEWSAPMAWPVVGIHAHLLPNGKVLTFGRTGHNPAVWDPATPTVFTSTARPADFFCSGHVLLPDGRLLVAGGHAGADNFGLKTAYYFDYVTSTWTRGSDMQNGRWYPTNTTLPNGEVLTIGGGDTAAVMNVIPEVWQTDGTWRELTGASISIAYYSMMFVIPDGRVFAAGPARGTRFFTTSGSGTLAVGPSSNFGSRDYGSAVMYQSGKILLVGGGQTPTATTEVIDLNGGAGAWRYVGPLAVARRQLNATLLADGKVLATGGTNAPGFNTAPTDSRVLAAELWDPATEQWTPLGRMSHQRVYHSAALLLPDGRVLSVGSGEPAATGLSDDYTAEIFSPPYLFNPDGTPAARPPLNGAPLSIGYGQSFPVQTSDPASIARVTWIRLSSVTHSFNQNQRMNSLTYSTSGTTGLVINAPGDSRQAPPGHYLLFLINHAGVPSVGKIIKIQ